jgi:SAM-dependent methyltransferase
VVQAPIDLSSSFRHISDDQYFYLLMQSVESRVIEGVTFPGFPDDQIQATFVGSAGRQALFEAHEFWRLLKSTAAALGRPLGSGTRALDFGCGWGRYLRFLNKDVSSDALFGVDVNAEILADCARMGVPGRLSRIEPLGTLPLPDESIDVAMAYSVFTHLPEAVHLHWMRELTRVCRPGAVMFLTTQPRRFLDFVRDAAPLSNSVWHQRLAAFAPATAESLAAFDAGRLVFLDTEQTPYYGDALVPRAWLAAHWSGWRLREYLDDSARFKQAVVVLQRD